MNSKSDVDYDKAPSNSAVLVTPRHSVRHAWNTAMAKKLCRSNKKPLIVLHAVDTLAGHPLTVTEQYAVLTKPSTKKDGTNKERAGLVKIVEMEEGIEVMVTWNVHTELDIFNGARGMNHLCFI